MSLSSLLSKFTVLVVLVGTNGVGGLIEIDCADEVARQQENALTEVGLTRKTIKELRELYKDEPSLPGASPPELIRDRLAEALPKFQRDKASLIPLLIALATAKTPMTLDELNLIEEMVELKAGLARNRNLILIQLQTLGGDRIEAFGKAQHSLRNGVSGSYLLTQIFRTDAEKFILFGDAGGKSPCYESLARRLLGSQGVPDVVKEVISREREFEKRHGYGIHRFLREYMIRLARYFNIDYV